MSESAVGRCRRIARPDLYELLCDSVRAHIEFTDRNCADAVRDELFDIVVRHFERSGSPADLDVPVLSALLSMFLDVDLVLFNHATILRRPVRVKDVNIWLAVNADADSGLHSVSVDAVGDDGNPVVRVVAVGQFTTQSALMISMSSLLTAHEVMRKCR